MINKIKLKQVIDFIRFTFTAIIAIIVFRLIALSISVDLFRDAENGRLSTTGYYVKFFQVITENLTNPLIHPFKSLIELMGNVDKGLVVILAPVFAILSLFILNFMLKMITPYIVSKERDEYDDFYDRYK